MKKLLLILFCLFFATKVYAISPTQRITIEPLEEISFNTVTVGTSWVTASTGLINRKAINIFNISDSEIVFIGESTTADTVSITNSRWLYPRQGITLGLSSKRNVYVSTDTATLVQIIEMR